MLNAKVTSIQITWTVEYPNQSFLSSIKVQ